MPGRAHGISSGSAIYGSGNFLDMNRQRPNLLRWFLHRGLTFLYLDADTVWRTNMLDVFEEARNVDNGEPGDAIFTTDNSDTDKQFCSCTDGPLGVRTIRWL
jgi:Nucleotide-diphospho-sugar transferase